MLPKDKTKIKEYKKKLSDKAKGNKNSLGAKRSKDWKDKLRIRNVTTFTGKKQSIEAIDKRRKKMMGELNPSWKGGITPINFKIRSSFEYKLWREAVFERDNYTCVWCGDRCRKGKSVYLEADHIKPFCDYPELRFAIDNGRTLCKECHKKTDTYGWKIYNKKKYGKDSPNHFSTPQAT